MCGIAGFLTRPGERPDRDLAVRMCDRLAHRGPDAAGYYFEGPAALGHRRLSIIDLSGGDQPLGNEDGSLQVVFNGEIYNYQELRQELEDKGHRFSTRSDTETLVHLYEEEGERMPERLNGMFAFAIWDARRQELFLARDRFGKKPLYYAAGAAGLRFCFASELKALTALPGFDNAVSARSVANFLSLSYVPDPDSVYEGVFKLPPGHSLLAAESGLRLRRYWAPRFERNEAAKFPDTVEEIRALAADAVKRRLMSDVPLGAFLSGGVDSSAVTGMMADSGRVKTFSIGFTNERYNELPYARRVAERYSTDHHERVVAPEIAEMLDKLAEHYDEPFGDSSAIPTLYLSRLTRERVTVALSGDGADEIFGGYRRYYFGGLEERLRARFPGWFRRSVIRLAGRLYPQVDYLPQPLRAKTLLTNLSHEIGDAYFRAMSHFRDGELTAVLAPELRRALGGHSPRTEFRQRFEAVRHLAPLEQMQAVDFATWLPGDILVKADRATMAYSLESRSPWLDYRLCEAACRIPAEWKMRGRIGKYIFKRAVEPWVPSELVSRRKMGFSMPLAEWFRGGLRPAFQALALDPCMERYLWLPEVRRIWDEHQSGRRNHGQRLWNVLMLAAWAARHRRASSSEVFAGAAAE